VVGWQAEPSIRCLAFVLGPHLNEQSEASAKKGFNCFKSCFTSKLNHLICSFVRSLVMRGLLRRSLRSISAWLRFIEGWMETFLRGIEG